MSSNSFGKKVFFKAAIIIAIFWLLALWNPVNLFGGVRSSFFGVTYFFGRIFQVSAEKISGGVSVVSSISELKVDNEDLSQENLVLKAENIRLKKIEKENEFLREQLSLLPLDKFEMESAQIIGRGTEGLNDWIVVDKGSEHGIQKGMPVVISDSVLVGRIVEVLPKNSKVSLITNATSAVNAITLDTNAKGVIKGEYGLGLVLDMVLETSSLNVGDTVITSEIGSIPEGFFIGVIKEVRPSSDYLFQQAVISSPVDFSSLDIVFIVK
ncbi:rod shape-determining protein MreC [Patescibacteria group bacterium]